MNDNIWNHHEGKTRAKKNALGSHNGEEKDVKESTISEGSTNSATLFAIRRNPRAITTDSYEKDILPTMEDPSFRSQQTHFSYGEMWDQQAKHLPQSTRTTITMDEAQLNSVWKADVYAELYVPQFLKRINLLPAIPVYTRPLPSIDFKAFVNTFAGSLFLTSLEDTHNLKEKPLSGRVPFAELTTANYEAFFSELLSGELYATIDNYQKYELYNVPVTVFDANKNLYKISVPGIVEDNPPVRLNDSLALRQLRINPYIAFSEAAVQFTGYENFGLIAGVNKAKGYIVVKIDYLVQESMHFNVIFAVPELYRSHKRAIHTIQKALSVENKRPWLTSILFPEISDCIMQTKPNQGHFSRTWFDQDLNYEQQKAVDSILKQNYGHVPFLISGPPGTGKTKVIVEATLQYILSNTTQEDRHLLLLAPSDQAADTLALRLAPYFDINELLRLQNSTRTFAEIPDRILQYCYVQHGELDIFGLPEWKTLLAYKLVITSSRDSNLLVEARCTNRDLYALETSIYRCIHSGATQYHPPALHWTGLFLDEAAQGTEAETAIAISVVVPPEGFEGKVPFLVMAGDHQQLGPRLRARHIDLERSLFERLINRPLFAKHPLTRMNMTNLSTPLPYPRPAFINLIRNYRSHPAILSIPSAVFYHDTLICEAKNVNNMMHWKGWQGRKWPVLFVRNDGLDEWEGEGFSYYNIREIEIVKNLVLSLIDSELIEPYEIAVMSPFRGQIRRIRLCLRNTRFELRDVNVGSVEDFQGSEHRFVIVCTTRARERFLEIDIGKGLGIIYERKRLTVASTRAKAGLIFVGNPYILQRDPAWLAILSFCHRHGLIRDILNDTQLNKDTAGETKRQDQHQGRESNHTSTWKPSDSEVMAPQYVGRLERGLMYSIHVKNNDTLERGQLNSTAIDADDAMYLAAQAAEIALARHDTMHFSA